MGVRTDLAQYRCTLDPNIAFYAYCTAHDTLGDPANVYIEGEASYLIRDTMTKIIDGVNGPSGMSVWVYTASHAADTGVHSINIVPEFTGGIFGRRASGTYTIVPDKIETGS